MSDLRKAAEMALKTLENERLKKDEHLLAVVEEALRQALAQPEQEPVAWQDPQYKTLIEPHKAHSDWIPLYAAPPKREWQGLTGGEQDTIVRMANDSLDAICLTEAKLKEKNT